MFATTTKENVASALKSFLGTKAESAYEKYQLLEQRDKILRKARQRVSDVQRAAVFVGACPDMCPEKERYEREFQKRLSSFEIIPSMGIGGGQEVTVDHRRAVKDYGRSAADQEEPLPYELRPAPVLQMTMDYLLNEIAYNEPSEDGQLTSWYDFLWKRTRAIRKDMTQQMLEGEIALSLLEKCARFHIFCAHRLCELDVGDFDQRMNTENLTKCLQSLKHMYEDMAKKGIQCSNEAEFRAYDVLLSLNDTDVLRQILTYNVQVRQSAHVRFALKLFSAMQNNNYVAFFRFVRRRAVYLQACLVHRYFNVIRSKAFNTLVRSYGANSQFPVTEVTRMLGFENDQETIQSALQYGLTTHPKYGNLLVLNRWQMASADEQQSPAIKRAFTLVESKRQGNLGEILNGGQLTPVDLPSPVISFDKNDYYVGDSVVNEMIQESSLSTKPTPVFPNVDPEQQRLRQMTQYAAASVMESVTKSAVMESAGNELTLFKLVNGIVSGVVVDHVRIVAKEIVDVEKKNAIERYQMENLRKSANAFQQKACDGILMASVASSVSQLARDVTREEQNVQSKKRLHCWSLEYSDHVISRTVEQEIRNICASVCHELQSTLSSLNRIRRNLSNILARRYLHKWRLAAWMKTHRRRILNEFPSCPSAGYEDNVQQPIEKKMRTSFHSASISSHHWMEILTAKQLAFTTFSNILENAIGPLLIAMAINEMQQETLLRYMPDTALDSTKTTEATVQLLNEFPCQPSSFPDVNDTSSARMQPFSSRKHQNESVYSWMDAIANAGPSVVKSKIPNSRDVSYKMTQYYQPVNEGNISEIIQSDGRKSNYFAEIALRPEEAMKQETLAAFKRLRSAVQTESQLSSTDLAQWIDKIGENEQNADGDDGL